MVYKGQDAQLAVARESTFKTRPSTVGQQPSGGVMDAVDVTEEITKEELRAMGGSRNYAQLVDVDEVYEVSFPIYVQDLKIMEFVLGNVNENTGSATTAPYDHEITETQGLPTLTIEHAEFNQDGGNDIVRTFLGCVADEATFSSSDGDPACQLELTFLAADMDTTNSNDSTSLISTAPFQHDDLVTAQFDTTSIPHISELSIDISNNTERLPDNGSLEDGDMVPLNREYEITVTHNPQDDTFHSKWKSSTESSATFKYERDGDSNDSIEFSFTKAQIEEPGFSTPLEDVEEAELSMRAQSLKINVQNDSSTYSLS